VQIDLAAAPVIPMTTTGGGPAVILCDIASLFQRNT